MPSREHILLPSPPFSTVKLSLVDDIHTNLPALRAAIAALKTGTLYVEFRRMPYLVAAVQRDM